MNKIKCSKCGNEYDDFFTECPHCKNFRNYDGLVDLSEINNDNQEKTDNSIIFNEEDLDESLSKKEEVINKRNQSLKNSKNNKSIPNKQYSYLLLFMGMILLFIIMFSSFQDFALIPLIHYSITILLLFIAFNLSYRDIEFGYIIAIISSLSMIFMIYESDYISAIIGIYIFTSSFRFLIKR